MKDIITILGLREDLFKRPENGNASQHKGIKMLGEEMQYLKLENNKLKENNNTQLSIIEFLSENRIITNGKISEKTKITTNTITKGTNTSLLPIETRNSFSPLHVKELSAIITRLLTTTDIITAMATL